MGIAAAAAASSPAPAETADPPAKEEIQRTTAAETARSSDAGEPDAGGGGGGGAGEEGETVVVDTAKEAGDDGEGEEEGECGFCLFMKGGGCKEEFVGWEKCVEEAEAAGGDVVERCYGATAALRRCMDAHADYYEPILRAERAMVEDLETAKAGEASPAPSDPPAPAVEEGDEEKQPDEGVASEKGDLAA